MVYDVTMGPVEYPIREPTGRAWLALIVGVVASGELLFERHQKQTVTVFNMRLSEAETWLAVVPLLVLAALALTWLVRLYLRPGVVRIDPASGRLTRVRRGLLVSRSAEASLADWKVQVHFFSETERERGTWKRLVLAGPGVREVMLWTDVSRGDALLGLLRQARPALEVSEIVDHPA